MARPSFGPVRCNNRPHKTTTTDGWCGVIAKNMLFFFPCELNTQEVDLSAFYGRRVEAPSSGRTVGSFNAPLAYLL